MNKTNMILICIIIALVSGIIGFIIGMNAKGNSETNSISINNEEKNLAGTYKTNTWNGKEAVLVLNTDGTMIYPTGARGNWSLEDGKLYVEFETSSSYADGEIHIETKNNKMEITIVSGGLMINTHFFEKIK